MIGILFYVYMLGFSIANVAVIKCLPVSLFFRIKLHRILMWNYSKLDLMGLLSP